jgi:hypothetical protein
MTGKLLAVVVAGALVAGSAGVAVAQYGTGQQETRQAKLRAADACALLVRDSYRRFTDFTPDGENFTADVLKNGKVFEVLIDPGTGKVQPQIVPARPM